MGTFRRSRFPAALPPIQALMHSFRTEKLKTKDKGKRMHVNKGRYGETPPERGTFSGLRYIQR